MYRNFIHKDLFANTVFLIRSVLFLFFFLFIYLFIFFFIFFFKALGVFSDVKRKVGKTHGPTITAPKFSW